MENFNFLKTNRLTSIRVLLCPVMHKCSICFKKILWVHEIFSVLAFFLEVKIKQDIYALCEECDIAITNPICPDCLERQAVTWLIERNKEVLAMRIRERIEKVNRQSRNSYSNVNCVICKNKLSICPHCTSKEILKVLNKERRLHNDFLSLFDYID